MKLSENANYRKYMYCRARDDFEGARRHLHACLDDLRGQEFESAYRAFLLQTIGDLFFLEGRNAEAFQYHEMAERTDPTVLLTQLHYAKFLARAGEVTKAVEKCDNIIAAALEKPLPESDNNFGSDYYIRHAQELKDECTKRSEN